MGSKLKNFFKYIFAIEPEDRIKVLLLTLSFFLVIGGYTIIRELKDSIFTSIVAGTQRKYLMQAKMLSMLLLIPALFLHARLVDKLRTHYLLYFYTVFYGVAGLLCAYYLGDPQIGLANKVADPHRIFGWLFYFLIEGYSPFVVSVFWAFANSITSPESAKNNYTLMIAGSKIGGIITALLSCWMLTKYFLNDIVNHQILTAGASLLLLMVPFVVYLLVKYVPAKNLHGYEAGYQVDKEIEKEEAKKTGVLEGLNSMLAGLWLLFKYPYVLGIFGLSFFFEVINQAFKIENIVFGVSSASTLSGFSSFLLMQAMFVHMAGLCVVLFGTRAIINALGEKKSLMLVPTLTGLSVLYFVFRQSQFAATIAFVVTRSINYAFAVPLRESLYIPTIKEVQFKSKSWIDGFGTKFAKTFAVSFNSLTDGFPVHLRLTFQAAFFSITIFVWFITSYALGRRYEQAVERNEVIGAEEITA